MNRIMLLSLLAVGLTLLVSCSSGDEEAERSAQGQVVLYSSVDQQHLQPIIQRFEQETGLSVRVITDGEASKTVGLAARVEAERDNPQADVYWGNEVFHTIRLADAGVLESYRPSTAREVPARWRDAADRWVAVGLRARVIVISDRPQDREAVATIRGLADLARPELRGRIGMAHPGFGTTSGHMAALQATLGQEAYLSLLEKWKDNGMKLLGGNGSVVEQVASGNLLAGLTDNDDVANAQRQQEPVSLIVPDQAGIGTLLVPTTVALVKGAPHPQAARRLLEFIASASVEQDLLDARFLAYSVRGDVQVKGMTAADVELAQRMPQAVAAALKVLEGR